jgi:uroporphyrin-III C-methyltransferase
VNGKVYLVGAGPGDPELLTLRAAALLARADVVLHDDLVAREILHRVSPRAEVRNVGKRCGKKKISQEEINFLMIEYAALGKQVVRLKSGDPLIFGRTGEEIAALRRAGVGFEIVPGVTSAFGGAAVAEIPLTERQRSHAITLVTGHEADGEKVDWKKLAASRATLAIYMPGREYGEIRKRLLGAGVEAGTPCAIVSRATQTDQRTWVTTVEKLHEAHPLAAPTLLIVGSVVEFRAQTELEELGVAEAVIREREKPQEAGA